MTHAPRDRRGERGRHNLPLATLDPASLEVVIPRLSSTWIERSKVLATPTRPLRALYFPETAVVSVARRVGRRRIPVMSIGNEGIVGHWLDAAAGGQVAVDVVCVVPGHALRLPVRYLGEAILARPSVRELTAEVTQSAMVQLMQNVMCEKIHALPARCARILMELTHTLGSVFELTHEELAALLSATRPSTTRVMNWLAADAIIEYARGTIRVLDLAALEARSCGCYGTLLARRQRLLRLVSPGRPDHHHDVGPAARASRAVAGARP